MNETRIDLYFFHWFEHNYAKINIKEDNKNIQTKKEDDSITHSESQIIVFHLKITSLNDDNMNNII